MKSFNEHNEDYINDGIIDTDDDSEEKKEFFKDNKIDDGFVVTRGIDSIRIGISKKKPSEQILGSYDVLFVVTGVTKEQLQSCIDEYNQFVTGEVYIVEVLKEKKVISLERVDSLGGIFSSDWEEGAIKEAIDNGLEA